MNTRKSKNSIQLMKEFTSSDLFNFNNNPEISSFVTRIAPKIFSILSILKREV